MLEISFGVSEKFEYTAANNTKLCVVLRIKSHLAGMKELKHTEPSVFVKVKSHQAVMKLRVIIRV